MADVEQWLARVPELQGGKYPGFDPAEAEKTFQEILDAGKEGVIALIDTLKEVVAIVCEVEFIPLYLNQPLFGDVCTFLTTQGLMFHKFLGMAGRSLKPFVIGKNPDFPTQFMWSDAVFIKHIHRLPELPPDKLLKMGLLAYIYGSPDVTYQCFRIHDHQKGTCLHKAFMDLEDR